MKTFDKQSFRQFLGQPICKKHPWGMEQHFKVSEDTLAAYEELLRGTIYHHHSSFDFSDEVREVGFRLAAQAMRQRNYGNPADDKTQMGNLGEVIGAEFSQAYLGFQTTHTFPKRLNPNVDQSMKGVDIIGLRENDKSAELLIGEAKCAKEHSKRLVEHAYDHLVKLETGEAPRILRFMKEYHSLRDERHLVVNTERHMARDVLRHYLILSITQTAPRSPFGVIAEQVKKSPIYGPLHAVHIQFCNVKSWLSKLFEP